ncbi:hypothetical protein RHSIM_Rhsim10G0208700 [Rhododendron simsii]|uniref:Uncharacterized protein n=1 Tax=Rhododendron simsii TaxID=118357 RepID=A0A834GAS0_RHOSS|nr:hypothetical protein RHSIM_Rhsim10G0208700 [Rhododendron simsii]
MVRCTKFEVSHRDGLEVSVVCRETYVIGHPLDIDILALPSSFVVGSPPRATVSCIVTATKGTPLVKNFVPSILMA